MNGIMSEIQVLLPKLKSEQSKIAEILETVDRAIEQTEAILAKQQRIKTAFMQDLLRKGMDACGNIRSEETHTFKDSPFGRIPDEWDVRTIDELVTRVGSGITPKGGESVYQKDGVLFIRSQNVHFGNLVLDDVAYISEAIHKTMKSSEVFENDILLNITGASIGRSCYIKSLHSSANTNQHVCAIRLINANFYDAGYLSLVMESSIVQNQIKQFNAGGNREGLNYQQIRSFKIPFPAASERKKIYDRLEHQNSVMDSHIKNLNKLRQLKTAIMQDLLTGKVRVTPLLNETEVNIDENG